MAEFSKQWCEMNDPDMPWDFDIFEIANNLTQNFYIPYICEGFGFFVKTGIWDLRHKRCKKISDIFHAF